VAKIQKLCFVIMGFGKKTDLSTGKTLDLDKTYKNIIRPAVEKSGLKCVRADEIQDSTNRTVFIRFLQRVIQC
jgi:hypothetical protein